MNKGMKRTGQGLALAGLMATSALASASNHYELYWNGAMAWGARVWITFVGDPIADPDVENGVVGNIRDVTLTLETRLIEPVGGSWTVWSRGPSVHGQAYVSEQQWASNMIISGYEEMYGGTQRYVEFSMLGEFKDHPGSLCVNASILDNYGQSPGCKPMSGWYNWNEWHLKNLGPVASPVPEPAAASMLGTGLLGLVGFAAVRRRRTRAA